jgi:hypothetical protein
VAASVVLAGAVGGCGGGSGSPPTSPLASLVPPSAAVFLDAAVRPQGTLKSSLEASLSKLLGTEDPGGYLTAKLDHALRRSGLTYSRDIEPWLGERAGIFVQSFGPPTKAAALIETTDAGATLATLRKAALAASHRPHPGRYRGVDVEIAADGSYAAVGRVVAVGRREP